MIHTHTHTHTRAQFKPVGFWLNRSRRGYRNSYFYKVHRWLWSSTRFVNHYPRRPRTYGFDFYSYFVLTTQCASSKYSAHCTWSSCIEETSGEASRPLSALGAACTWWVIEIPTHFLIRLGSLPIAQGKWVWFLKWYCGFLFCFCFFLNLPSKNLTIKPNYVKQYQPSKDYYKIWVMSLRNWLLRQIKWQTFYKISAWWDKKNCQKTGTRQQTRYTYLSPFLPQIPWITESERERFKNREHESGSF